jgi:RNA polymerase sigma-70 factor (ECF subfamily)
MNVDSLESLLDELNGGSDAAAERAFLAYEPYLRKVVRRLLPPNLRAKFDSIDVVQSVYCDVLVAFRASGMRFASVPQLRAFLVAATRNRFIDRVRQHRSAARLEQPLPDDGLAAARSPTPRPSESAVAAELWERLLALCPPEHHALLELRRAGASAREIAARLGMHDGSVRRILRGLSVRLACSVAHSAELTQR